MERRRKINLDDNGVNSVKRTKETNRWTGQAFSDRYYSILQGRQKLPVYQFKDKLVQTVKDNQVVIVEGETGSGSKCLFLLGCFGSP